MSNLIGFHHGSDKDNLSEHLHISNGSMSMFINILCLSGGRLAQTESQKRLMVFLAENNQSARGLGAVGFDIVEMPWDKESFDEDKAFMLKVITGAQNKLGWETLGYYPNEEFAAKFLNVFSKLIEQMTVEDIIEASLTDWLSATDERDPVKIGFPKCKIHDAYISVFGCQICTD